MLTACNRFRSTQDSLFGLQPQRNPSCYPPTFVLLLLMLPFIIFQIDNIKGGVATFYIFFTLLVDAFLLNFLNKTKKSNLINLTICYHNIYKCIVIFHFLRKVRVCCLLDSLNKNPMSNLKRWNTCFRTTCNKNLPFCFGLKISAYSGRFSASPLSANKDCQSVKTCRCLVWSSF